MADIIQQRRDTAARWAQYNPILLEGEVGYVTDNPNQYKIGNGRDKWNDLPLRGYTGTITQETGNDENAVMSQKVVTEKLSELGVGNVFKLVGNDSTGVFKRYEGAVKGHIYRIIPKVTEWEVSSDTSEGVSKLQIYYSNKTSGVYIHTSKSASRTIADFYDVKMPDDYSPKYLYVYVRAKKGTELPFTIVDVTEEYGRISEIGGNIPFRKGFQIYTQAEIGGVCPLIEYESDSWQYAIKECEQNDVFKISGSGGSNPLLWCFIDNEGKIVAKSGLSDTFEGYLYAPKNAKKLIVNTKYEQGLLYFYGHKGSEILDNTNKISSLTRSSAINNTVSLRGKKGYIGVNGGFMKSTKGNSEYSIVRVLKGDMVVVDAAMYNDGTQLAFSTSDDIDTFVPVATSKEYDSGGNYIKSTNLYEVKEDGFVCISYIVNGTKQGYDYTNFISVIPNYERYDIAMQQKTIKDGTPTNSDMYLSLKNNMRTPAFGKLCFLVPEGYSIVTRFNFVGKSYIGKQGLNGEQHCVIDAESESKDINILVRKNDSSVITEDDFKAFKLIGFYTNNTLMVDGLSNDYSESKTSGDGSVYMPNFVDVECEQGSITTEDEKTESSNVIRTKNFIKVNSKVNIRINESFQYFVAYYDDEYTFVSREPFYTYYNRTISYSGYIKICVRKSDQSEIVPLEIDNANLNVTTISFESNPMFNVPIRIGSISSALPNTGQFVPSTNRITTGSILPIPRCGFIEYYTNEELVITTIAYYRNGKVVNANSTGATSSYEYVDKTKVVVFPSDKYDGVVLVARKHDSTDITDDEFEKFFIKAKYVNNDERLQSYIVENNNNLKPIKNYCYRRYSNYFDTPTQLDALGNISEGTSFANYLWNYQELIDNIYEPLRLANPRYIKREVIGKDASGTYDIYAYTFGPKYPQQSIFLVSGVHGGAERTSYLCLGRIMQMITNEYRTHPDLEFLRRNVKITVVPVLNAYGMSIQGETVSGENYQSRKFNANGVNLNSEALVKNPQPENQALRSLLDKLKDELSFGLDLHTTVHNTYGDFMYTFVRDGKNVKTSMRTIHYLCDKWVEGEPNIPNVGITSSANTWTAYMNNTLGVTASTCEFTDRYWDGNNMYTSKCCTICVDTFINLIIQQVNDFYRLLLDVPEDVYHSVTG